MRAVITTEPGRADQPNEDYAAVSGCSAVLVDGASPFGSDSGCLHGVAWYARQLGAALLAALDAPRKTPLPDCLAEAITQVAGLHERTCDLSHLGTPSATVLALRCGTADLEYLVLADSTLLLDHGGPQLVVVTDDREASSGRSLRYLMDDHPAGTPEHVAGARAYVEALRAYRNRPGGFWVASVDPRAAEEAITGAAPLADLRGVALLSDGATRLVDRFELLDWRKLGDLLIADGGPAELIRRTREAERSDPYATRWPRSKTYDDATVVTCRLTGALATSRT